MEEELEFEEKLILYCYGLLSDLKEKGLLEGGKMELTGYGTNIYRQLVDEGFHLPMKKLKEVLRLLSVMNKDWRKNNVYC